MLAPDLNNLHIDWRDQPRLVYDWNLKEAEARLELARAKDKLELVEAQLDHKIRKDPQRYGLAKATDTPVAMCVLLQPAYREAQEEYNLARYRADKIHAMVQALEHKKPALQDLVKLDSRSYWDSELRLEGEVGESIRQKVFNEGERKANRRLRDLRKEK